LIRDANVGVGGETLVTVASGPRIPVHQLVGQTLELSALENGRLAAGSGRIVCTGMQSVFRIKLATGRMVRAAASHCLLGASGGVPVGALTVRERVAIAREIRPAASTRCWSEHELALLGQLVGDGSYLRGSPLRYTTASEENSQIVHDAARRMGSTVKRYAGRGRWHQLLIGGNGNRWHASGVGRWLKEIGIFGQRSHEKRLPKEVFELGNAQVAFLLRHLWATDGSVSVRKAGQRGSDRVYFSTSSSDLAFDVAALLLRFGIVGRIRSWKEKNYRPCYSVDVSGWHQRVFLTEIGTFGPRNEPGKRLSEKLATRAANTNVDTLPPQAMDAVRTSMRERGIGAKRMAAMRDVTRDTSQNARFSPSRGLIDQYADVLADESLLQWSRSGVFWDRVVAVEADGWEPLFDVSVHKPICWLADAIACSSEAT
jgi:replicative DNA helicase